MPALENECFFIAPIGEEGSEIRRRSDGVLNFIVAHAAAELDLTAIRADQIAAPGQITLQVIDHILQAKAAVADLTGRNPNVFYELAVRHSARLPVTLIVAHDDPSLPFDIAQMRVIRFDYRDLASADQCRQAIVAHLREAVEGAVDSPIGASIDLRALGGGNRVERSIAEALAGIEELSRLQRMVLRTIGEQDMLERQRAEFERQQEMLERQQGMLERQQVELDRRVYMLQRRRSELDARISLIASQLPALLEGLKSSDEAVREHAIASLNDQIAALLAVSGAGSGGAGPRRSRQQSSETRSDGKTAKADSSTNDAQ